MNNIIKSKNICNCIEKIKEDILSNKREMWWIKLV